MKWKADSDRKPLILRGARQVGKTHAVRTLGKTFDHFVEINFEYSEIYRPIFEEDLDPHRIVRTLSILIKRPIEPGKTLLFFDEIQACPRAITSLRYFYEKMPELHVISAGSLLEFAHELIGIPVGRVESCYLYPMTFIEYLIADQEKLLVQEILEEKELPLSIHKQLLKHLGIFLALGGMPEVLKRWIEKKDPLLCSKIHATLLDSYRQDFEKYGKKSQIKYLSLLFDTLPRQIGEKFKYSKVGDYRKRELEPALELLLTAGIIHKVMHTAAQGIPIGADANPEKFKLIFIDVGLTQALLGLDLSAWFIQPEVELVNKGKIVESYVGQELLAYSSGYKKPQLYYWQKETRGSSAEIDYMIQKGSHIIPIEVKSGMSGKMRSLHAFLNSHPYTDYGVKTSIDTFRLSKPILSIPLYFLGCLSGDKEDIQALCNASH